MTQQVIITITDLNKFTQRRHNEKLRKHMQYLGNDVTIVSANSAISVDNKLVTTLLVSK